MVVVDKLTEVAHFIPVKSMNKTDDIAKIFMNRANAHPRQECQNAPEPSHKAVKGAIGALRS